MKNWLKKITGIEAKEQKLALIETAYHAELKRIENEKEQLEKEKKAIANKKLSPKDRATKAGEPYIDILSVDIDKENPSYGNFELDWNDYFIAKLRSMGYPGETDEVVVDLWFQSVCRNILTETWEQEVANRDNVRYISRRDLGDGKTEVR